MNRVLILEGCDGAGKSTLAETLRKDHGFKVIHTGRPDPHWDSKRLFEEYSNTLFDALHDDQPVAFDRHYLGESVYGPIMRGGSLLTTSQAKLLERVCRANDVKVVLCAPEFGTVLQNWQAKHEDYVDHEVKLKAIYRKYIELAAVRPDLVELYDYEAPKVTDDDEIYYGNSQWLSMFAPKPTLPRGFIGSPGARLLVVGEKVNLNVIKKDWAFYDDGGCSEFLNAALEESLIPESDLAFTNAIDIHDFPRDFERLLPHLPKLRAVVALGNVAQSILSKQNLKTVAVKGLPHPAWLKRFHANKNTFAQDLRRIYEEALLCSSPATQ